MPFLFAQADAQQKQCLTDQLVDYCDRLATAASDGAVMKAETTASEAAAADAAASRLHCEAALERAHQQLAALSM